MKIFDSIHFWIIFILICVFGQLSSADIPKITCNDARAGKVEDAKPILAREAQYTERAEQFKTKMRTYPTYIETNVPENRFCPIPLSSTFSVEQQKKMIEKTKILDGTSYNWGDYADIALPFDPNTKKQWNLGNGESIRNCNKNSDCFSLNDDTYQGYCEYAVQPSVNFYVDKNVFNPVTSTYSEAKVHKFCYKMRKSDIPFALPRNETGLSVCENRDTCDQQKSNIYRSWDCRHVTSVSFDLQLCTIEFQTTLLYADSPSPNFTDSDLDQVLLPYERTSNSLIPKIRTLDLADRCSTNADCAHLNRVKFYGYCFRSKQSLNIEYENGTHPQFCYALIPVKNEHYIMKGEQLGPRHCLHLAGCSPGYTCHTPKLKHLDSDGTYWNKYSRLYCTMNDTLLPKFCTEDVPLYRGPYSMTNPKALLTDDFTGQYCSKNSDCYDSDDYLGLESGFCSPSVFKGDGFLEDAKVNLCYKLVNEPKIQYLKQPNGMGPPQCVKNADCPGVDYYCFQSFLYFDTLKTYKFCVRDKCLFDKFRTKAAPGYVKQKLSAVHPRLYCPIPYPSSLRKEDVDRINPTVDEYTRLVSKEFLSISYPFDPKTKNQCNTNVDCRHLNKLGIQGYCQPSKHSQVYKNSDGRSDEKAKFCYALIPYNNEDYSIVKDRIGLTTCVDKCPKEFTCRDAKLKYLNNTGTRLCSKDFHFIPDLFNEDPPFKSGPYENRRLIKLLTTNYLNENVCKKNKHCFFLGKASGFCSLSKIFATSIISFETTLNFCYKLEEEPNIEYLVQPDIIGPPTCNYNKDCNGGETSDIPFCRSSTIYTDKQLCVRGRPRTALFPGVRDFDLENEKIREIILPYDKNYTQQLPIAPNDSYICSRNRDCLLDSLDYTGYCYPSIDHSKEKDTKNEAFTLCYKIPNDGNFGFIVPSEQIGPVFCDTSKDCGIGNICDIVGLSGVRLCARGADYCMDEKWPAKVGTNISELGYQYKGPSAVTNNTSVYCAVAFSSIFDFDDVKILAAETDVRTNKSRDTSFVQVTYPWDPATETQWNFTSKDWHIPPCKSNSDCDYVENDDYIAYCQPSWNPMFTEKDDMRTNESYCYRMIRLDVHFVAGDNDMGLIKCMNDEDCAIKVDVTNHTLKCTKVNITNGDAKVEKRFCTDSALRPALFNGVGFIDIDTKLMQDSLLPFVVDRKELVPEQPSVDMQCYFNDECELHTDANYTGYCYNIADWFTSNGTFTEKDDRKFCFKLKNMENIEYYVHPHNIGPDTCKSDSRCNLRSYNNNKDPFYCKKLAGAYDLPEMKDLGVCARDIKSNGTLVGSTVNPQEG